MSDIYFNWRGETHSLRIRPVDEKPGEVTVYEGMVDSTVLFWFEGSHPDEIEIWELVELAVQSFLDYRVEDHVELKAWKTEKGRA